ncbi:MAG: hypothetical protein DHS20C02_07630 [Micavibrio sp.]|nr:MAG: hypothetical protein DHS20C02_07630 [Micavibrio sp.]
MKPINVIILSLVVGLGSGIVGFLGGKTVGYQEGLNNREILNWPPLKNDCHSQDIKWGKEAQEKLIEPFKKALNIETAVDDRTGDILIEGLKLEPAHLTNDAVYAVGKTVINIEKFSQTVDDDRKKTGCSYEYNDGLVQAFRDVVLHTNQAIIDVLRKSPQDYTHIDTELIGEQLKQDLQSLRR